MRMRSSLWDHYQKKNNELATCNHCLKTLSYKATLTNLRKHLIRHSNVSMESQELPRTQYTHNGQGRRNKSRTWSYFTKADDDKRTAVCNHCKKIISYKATITNLRQHLKMHRAVYQQFMEDISSGLSTEPAASVPAENQDEDSNSSLKFSAEIWEQFETQDSNSRCCTCQETIDNNIEAMKNHLEESHPMLLIKMLKKPTDPILTTDTTEECRSEAGSTQEAEVDSDMCTEVIYLEGESSGNIINHSSSTQVIQNSSNQEIESFLNYVGVLLRNMDKKMQTKMQLKILDVILSRRED